MKNFVKKQFLYALNAKFENKTNPNSIEPLFRDTKTNCN